MGKLKLRDVINSSLSFSSSDQQPSSQTTSMGFAGSFEDTSAYQVSAGNTLSTLVTMNTITTSNGVTLDSVTNSKITFSTNGNYYLAFSGQYRFSGGASSYDVTVWYSKNSNIVPNSAYTYTLTSSQNSQVLASIRDIISVNAGDYIQFYWYTSVSPSLGPNGIYLYTAPAGTNPTRPASPCVNVNVFKVS